MTAPAPAVGPAILSRTLLVRFVSLAGSSIGFYLPLAVVPLHADAAGARATAGLATGGLLIATVLCELATPRIVARIGYRSALAVGLVLLGAPALALLANPSVPLVVAVSVVRGIGFAICVVAGGALTAALILSMAVGAIGVGLLVSGVGFTAAFLLTAVAMLPFLAVAHREAIPRRDSQGDNPS